MKQATRRAPRQLQVQRDANFWAAITLRDALSDWEQPPSGYGADYWRLVEKAIEDIADRLERKS